MKKVYVKRLKEYENNEYEDEKIVAAMKRLKKDRKLPTSVALEEKTVKQLKTLGKKKGIPYQILMRMFILEGIEKMRKLSV